MGNELTTKLDSSVMEQVLIGGDLSKLTSPQRVQYYQKVCESIGVNPLTKPFEYITLNGKLTLYAKKDATDQLRNLHGVCIDDVDIVETATQFIVKVKGHNRDGRMDVEVGVVNKTDMQGNTANAQMKAVTKGKRRLTLSLCGLGWLDETEVETIPSAKPVIVDTETGEINPVVEGEVTSSTWTVDNTKNQWSTLENPAPSPHNTKERDFTKPGDPSIEEAEAIVGEDGVKYGDCSNEVLRGKAIGHSKKINGGKLNGKQQDDELFRLRGCNLIINTRESKLI
jgi:hypothetical protein